MIGQPEGWQKAFESRIRLSIMSVLAVQESLDFNALKELLDVTDGNLASHLKGLEKEGFVQVQKRFLGRKPNTIYAITITGYKALQAHIDALEKLLHQVSPTPGK